MPLYLMKKEDSCIIVFAKAPIMGHVKTRLAEDMDASAVLSLYRNFVKDIIDKIFDMGHHIKIFYDPSGSESLMREWLGDRHELVLQTGSDLGQKMANAFEYVFRNGTNQALLMGTDFPDLPKKIISDAMHVLKTNDAVIGPTIDGGYYLIGFSSATYLPMLFTDIPWGTSAVFQKTMDIFLSSGFVVHRLPEWRDVDVYDDLKDLILCLENQPDKAINTYSALKNIGMINV
jgi:rSAM/selenodomain-associated transferase 1